MTSSRRRLADNSSRNVRTAARAASLPRRMRHVHWDRSRQLIRRSRIKADGTHQGNRQRRLLVQVIGKARTEAVPSPRFAFYCIGDESLAV